MNLINQVMGGRHVVILGAGASIASTMRDPEANGYELPSMNNLPKVIAMEDLLECVPKECVDSNFEQLYSNLYAKDPENPILREMNNRIWDYFYKLKLPDKPTIYDYLVMSLREKDLIATFNWDPFLFQACCRNAKHISNPKLCFLHGSVAIGYDKEQNRMGPLCRNIDGAFFNYVPLLYPTGEKNYDKDPFICKNWKQIRDYLASGDTKRVTIFGYSAPKSDYLAMQLFKEAWTGTSERNFEQFELIDVRPEEEVKASWNDFIYSHHYDYHTDFFQSSIAQYPRRTCESYFCRYLPITQEEAFHESHPVPQNFNTFEEMWKWYQPLIDAEEEDMKKRQS